MSDKHKSKQLSADQQQKYEFLSHPIFQVAVKDSKKGDFSRTRAVFDELDSNFVFSLFKIPFVKDLQVPVIGWMSMDKMFLEKFLLEGSKSRVSKATDSSRELSGLGLVGLFPEAHVGEVNQNSFTVYKVDFFFRRFKEFTTKLLNPLLDKGKTLGGSIAGFAKPLFGKVATKRKEILADISRVAKKTFDSVSSTPPEEDIHKVSSFWLTRHEDLHREGKIPRVNSDSEVVLPGEVRKNTRTIKDIGYYLKDYFESAAFEEMRVDILALIDFNDKDKFKDRIEHRLIDIIRDFVLSERMLRYATQNNVNDVFDAIVSQVLINWFVAEGVVDRDKIYSDHVLDIPKPENINKALIKLRDTIRDLEKGIAGSLETAAADPQTGLQELLDNKSLDDKAFKKALNKIDAFKESRDKILTFMRHWGNWHIADIEQYKNETSATNGLGINAFEKVWALGLTKLVEPERLPNRKREDQYKVVHPYITSLRNSKYYLDNKDKISNLTLSA
jgi:hypothetical protein